MKHSLSRHSLSSAASAHVLQQATPTMALLNPTLQLAKYTGMVLFFVASLGLSACGDKDAATQTAPASSNEPAPASTEVVEAPTPTPEVATEQADASDAKATAADTTEGDSAASSDTADTPQDAATAPEPELAAGAGKELYESHCKQCHEGGLLGAPKFGDKAAWAPRIEQGKDTLYIHSAKGFKKMPAQATGDVSVAQVHAAVDYMVEHSS
ncbi:c-type cytochrome [Psychrobacter sp. I-STPA10]|uniref:c-type cytochrome n=1 Tax=Psychrobacter sp. I-STPA10 TaxID=2585769 RepID=UPI001E51D87D|nr:c-type cytochrome [Psychrobacter sp. I-STPA10]